MMPGLIWDEHNVVFICQEKGVTYAFPYTHDNGDETAQFFAIYDFFSLHGITIKEAPPNIIPESRAFVSE